MKIGRVEIKSCQYCGGEDFRYGYHSGSSRLDGAPGFLEDQEPIHHLVCAECGAIMSIKKHFLKLLMRMMIIVKT